MKIASIAKIGTLLLFTISILSAAAIQVPLTSLYNLLTLVRDVEASEGGSSSSSATGMDVEIPGVGIMRLTAINGTGYQGHIILDDKMELGVIANFKLHGKYVPSNEETGMMQQSAVPILNIQESQSMPDDRTKVWQWDFLVPTNESNSDGSSLTQNSEDITSSNSNDGEGISPNLLPPPLVSFRLNPGSSHLMNQASYSPFETNNHNLLYSLPNVQEDKKNFSLIDSSLDTTAATIHRENPQQVGTGSYSTLLVAGSAQKSGTIPSSVGTGKKVVDTIEGTIIEIWKLRDTFSETGAEAFHDWFRGASWLFDMEKTDADFAKARNEIQKVRDCVQNDKKFESEVSRQNTLRDIDDTEDSIITSMRIKLLPSLVFKFVSNADPTIWFPLAKFAMSKIAEANTEPFIKHDMDYIMKIGKAHCSDSQEKPPLPSAAECQLILNKNLKNFAQNGCLQVLNPQTPPQKQFVK